MTSNVDHEAAIDLYSASDTISRDEFDEHFRRFLMQGNRWKLVTKDSPDRLCEVHDRGNRGLTLLEEERRKRYALARDIVYGLHCLGLSKIEISGEPSMKSTSWDLVTAVGGSRDVIQDAYIAVVQSLGTRAKVKQETIDCLEAWSRWEIGARNTFQSKLHARDSLHHFIRSDTKLVQSRYLGDIISDRFFPTTETHRMEKAQEEWRLIRSGRLALELIRDAHLHSFKFGRGRDKACLEILSMEGIALVEVLAELRSKIVEKLGSGRDEEVGHILNQWHAESNEASHEKYYLSRRDGVWQSGDMSKGEEENKLGLSVLFTAHRMMDRTIRRAGEMEIKELEHVLRMGQAHPPEDRHAFVAIVNRMLDALSLKIQTEDGDVHRLALKKGAGDKASIQLSGSQSGKTRGFKRVGTLKVVPTETTYIGAWMRPPDPN